MKEAPANRASRFAALVVLLLLIGLVIGCGGDDEPSRSPEQIAQAWVDAINAQDYEVACELSVFENEAKCKEVLEQEPFGGGLKVEGLDARPHGGNTEAQFGISSTQDRTPRGKGWTAYAPLDGFAVERHGDEYKVHFEYSIIK